MAGGGWRCTFTEFYDHFYLHFMDVAFDATEFTLTCTITERGLMSGGVLAMFWQCSSSVLAVSLYIVQFFLAVRNIKALSVYMGSGHQYHI